MRGGDVHSTLKAAVGYAYSVQSRTGVWAVRPTSRIYDTALAAMLFSKAGMRGPFLAAHRFLRKAELPREAPMPALARKANLQWEWLFHHCAYHLATAGRDRRAAWAGVFCSRLRTGNPPVSLLPLFALLADKGALEWESLPKDWMAQLDVSAAFCDEAVGYDSLATLGAALGRARAVEDHWLVEGVERAILVAQSPNGSWRDDPALTAFLALMLSGRHAVNVGSAARYVANVQASKGGVAPPPDGSYETRVMVDALVASGHRLSCAESDVKSKQPSITAGAQRFNAWHEAAQLAQRMSAGGGALGVGDVQSVWDRLEREQNGDGGWGFCPGMQSNASSTASATLALSLAARYRAAKSGGGWLIRHQRCGGAWRFLPELFGPSPVRYNRPVEGQAMAIKALAALSNLARRKSSRAG